MVTVFIGLDSEDTKICESSLRRHSSIDLKVIHLSEKDLRAYGLLTRPQIPPYFGEIFDILSDAPQSTDFAFARFFIPILMRGKGRALFCDGDFLFRSDTAELFALFDDRYAVQVVKHDHSPVETEKMAGRTQTQYRRKNWSSLILWNCEHPSHEALTLDVLNCWPGRKLHAFDWLKDEEIGSLPETWNWLEGYSPPIDPKAVHYTRGTPGRLGKDLPYSGEWYGVR